MNTHSYTIVHYGVDYLPYALRSVHDHVDQLHVVYSAKPSQGHTTHMAPPETREEILKAAFAHDPEGKVRWHEVHHARYEGQHRDLAVEACADAGAEVVLVVDCDEVWDGDVLARMLEHVQREDRARNWLVNFTHLWRSFDWCVRDEMQPVRFLDLRHDAGVAYVPRELGAIYHFGYAVRSPIMAYKWTVHGHKGELRPGWWKEKWAVWPPVADCHPTCVDTWTPEAFDKEELPELMRQHPFYDLERIE